MPALHEQVSCELSESIRIRVPENSAWKLDVSRCEVLPVLRGEGERMSDFGTGFGIGMAVALVLLVIILKMKGWI